MDASSDSNGCGRTIVGSSQDGASLHGKLPRRWVKGPGGVHRLERALRSLASLRPLRWSLEASRTGRSYAHVARSHATHFEVEEAHLVDVQAGTVLLAMGGRGARGLDDKRCAEVVATGVHRGFHPPTTTHDGLRTAGARDDTHALVLLWRGVAPVDIAARVEEKLHTIELPHADADGSPVASRVVRSRSVLASCFAWSERAPRRRPWVTGAAAALVLGLGAVALFQQPARTPQASGVELAAQRPAEEHAVEAPVTTTTASIPDLTTPALAEADVARTVAKAVAATASPTTQPAKRPTPVVPFDPPRDAVYALRPTVHVDLGVDALRREARILGQARLLLQPPSSADLVLDGDELVLTGRVTREWLERAHRLRPALHDVPRLREEGLVVESTAFTRWREAHHALQPPSTIRLDVDGDTLVAEGAADHAWISEARGRADGVGGIDRLDLRRVVDLDRKRLDRARAHLASLGVLFEPGSSYLSVGQEATLERIASDARAVHEAAARVGVVAIVELVPPAPLSGPSHRVNGVQLELHQAHLVRELLRRRGAPDAEVVWPPPIGGPSALPTPEGRTWVRFRVSIRD